MDPLTPVNLAGMNESPAPQPEITSDPDLSLASPFLEKIPEIERPIVGKYIKDWDAGVTKKFQEIHETYKPYKELGVEPDQIREALQIIEYANSDPVGFYNHFKSRLEELNMLENMNQGGTPPPAPLPEFEGVPEQFVQRYSTLESKFNELAAYVEQEKAAKESSSQQQQLDNLLQKLHNDHGDFDDEAILGRILKGMSPEEAVKNYKTKIQEVIDSQNRRPVPPSLSGGRTVADQVDATKLQDKSTRVSTVASLLQAAASQR